MRVKRILILNSYSLTERNASDLVRVQAFLTGLGGEGFYSGKNLDVEIVDSNDLGELHRRTRAAVSREPIDLIHAVGTPNAIVAGEAGGGVPVVYYGAHPEGAGEARCRELGAVGMILTLPFTQNYKHFRFLRTLFPAARRVWVPFFRHTVFCQPGMAERHDAHRESFDDPWVAEGSPHLAYQSLSGLCDIIGLEYRELVYRDLNDLAAGLERLDPSEAMMMPYNDSVYCAGAPQLLTDFARSRNIPLFWNNNTEATRIGAVAAISGCFQEAGEATGRMAASILNGATVDEVGLVTSKKTYGSLHLGRAKALGLEITPKITERFDEILDEPA